MNNNKKIAIIGAMDCEITQIKNIMENIQPLILPNSNGYLGKIGTHEIILSKSGEGKVNAAMNVQFIIDKFNPDFIINTGIAGGIASGLSIGSIIIGTKLVQYDFDVTELGYAKGYLCTGINPKQPTYFCSDENLIIKFKQTISTFIPQEKIRTGIIATGDCFIANDKKKQDIHNTFGALACDMEGAAIAQVANYNKIPFIIIRAISDLADEEAKVSLDIFEKEIANLAAKTIGQVLEKF